MPFNLLKEYNDLLELVSLTEQDRIKSLLGIFNRDIRNNTHFYFNGKPIHPTPSTDGEDAMGTLFNHLTRKTVNQETNSREFDMKRSERLHWIKFHIDGRSPEKLLRFSVKEPKYGIRTYVYDNDEKYVIILEPKTNKTTGYEYYYLLTAYLLEGKDKMRDKIIKKYERREKDLY